MQQIRIRSRSSRNAERGFTLVEVSIILVVLTVLSTIMLPQLGGFSRLARFARVKEDLGALCSMMSRMLEDVGESAFFGDPSGGYGSVGPRLPVGLLVGAGDTPISESKHGAGPRRNWRLRVGDDFGLPSDDRSGHHKFLVDTIANHLISNTPLGDSDGGWRIPSETKEGFNSLFSWRGPYLNDGITADPWGMRYMANVFALYNPPGAKAKGRFGSGVVCLSAGPDGEVDTNFNQPGGWRTGDDDLTALLGAGGPK